MGCIFVFVICLFIGIGCSGGILVFWNGGFRLGVFFGGYYDSDVFENY